MKRTSLLLNLTLCLTFIIGVQSNAFGVNAIATVGPNTDVPNIFFSGGCSGTFDLITNNAFIRSKVGFGFNPNVAVQFTQMQGSCANYQINAQGIWHLPLGSPNGGPTQFNVIDNLNGDVLLTGTFSRAILHGRSGSSSLALTLWADNVLYGAGSLWVPANDPLNNGALAVAILSQNPVIATPIAEGGVGGPQVFQANGDINFGTQ